MARPITLAGIRAGNQVALEPPPRQRGNLFQCASLLEQMAGAGNNLQSLFGSQQSQGLPVEVDHQRVGAPTMSSVGAFTQGNAAAARSGRPPRETMARTDPGRRDAALRAAAAPGLAPK